MPPRDADRGSAQCRHPADRFDEAVSTERTLGHGICRVTSSIWLSTVSRLQCFSSPITRAHSRSVAAPGCSPVAMSVLRNTTSESDTAISSLTATRIWALIVEV